MFQLKFVESPKYRRDIDGLRAIAVLFVIFFHFGWLANGFLGVDVFFVISGYLITGILYKEIQDERLSLSNFYMRRVRRIIPLSLFISFTALVIGIATMLPDDLENLAQSVIATIFFSNNILLSITIRDYWDVANEYKPLMHTWSLGVEEQYYLIYPFLFTLIGKKKPDWLLPTITFLCLASLGLYLFTIDSPSRELQGYRFYLIFFRFWELALGGIIAIALKDKVLEHKFKALLILLLTGLMVFDFPFLSSTAELILVVMLTAGIVASNGDDQIASFILENKLFVAIGKISFSLYMWHQMLLAYTRYFVVQELAAFHYVLLFSLTIVLSILSYVLIEQPFRDKQKTSNKTLFTILVTILLLTTTSSFYIYSRAGVIRDVPELGIKASEVAPNLHAQYNAKIYELDADFTSTDKIKILVLGNSFARDWANILLESKFAKTIEISYIHGYKLETERKKLEQRVNLADVIFLYVDFSELPISSELPIPAEKLWIIGVKNFGTNAGIFYNYRGLDYYEQRTAIDERYFIENQQLLNLWDTRYMDYLGKILDENKTVPVFTPSLQFISQDCRHLTQAGAKYFAILFEDELTDIFSTIIFDGE